MVKMFLKSIAYRAAPGAARQLDEYLWVIKHGKQLARDLPSLTLEDKVRRLTAVNPIRSNQKFSEILGLLKILEQDPPRSFCEIGDAMGGTLALFSQVAAAGANAITIDLEFTRAQKKAYSILRGNTSSIACIEGDSHSVATLKRVRAILSENKLDFLFIDGDHSYDGVKKDFEMYSPLVRPGGIIAFHDIHPDYKTCKGTPTACDVGEVPRYWDELKRSVPIVAELVEDASQDGYGIGVVRAGGN